MPTPAHEPTAEEIEDDLMELIQDEGLTEVRMDALGKFIASAYDSDDPAYLVAKVTKQLESMEEDKYTTSLRHALVGTLSARLGGESAATLSARREYGLKQIEDAPSIDTVRRWERRAMRVLAKRILAEGARLREEGGARDYSNFARRSGGFEQQLDGLQMLVSEQEATIKALRSQVELIAEQLDRYMPGLTPARFLRGMDFDVSDPASWVDGTHWVPVGRRESSET